MTVIFNKASVLFQKTLISVYFKKYITFVNRNVFSSLIFFSEIQEASAESSWAQLYDPSTPSSKRR